MTNPLQWLKNAPVTGAARMAQEAKEQFITLPAVLTLITMSLSGVGFAMNMKAEQAVHARDIEANARAIERQQEQTNSALRDMRDDIRFIREEFAKQRSGK